jgi:hypothetical protein
MKEVTVNCVCEVLHLFQSLAYGEPMREFDEILAVESKGFKDCIHGRTGSDQPVLKRRPSRRVIPRNK